MHDKLEAALNELRSDPRGLLVGLLGHIEAYVAYRGVPSRILPSPNASDAVVRKISDEELIELSVTRSEMAIHHLVLGRLHHNDAYAAYVQGKPAHVLWLISSEHDRLYPIRNVKLREGEAEITHAVTLPEFRGRGLFQHAITVLASIAADRGMRRLWMITGTDNTASMRAIEKAGLTRSGRIWRYVPHRGLGGSVTLRCHRIALSSDA